MLSTFFAEYETDFCQLRTEIERSLAKQPTPNLNGKLRSAEMALRQLENELKPRFQSEPANPQVRKVIEYRKSFNEIASKAKEKLNSQSQNESRQNPGYSNKDFGQEKQKLVAARESAMQEEEKYHETSNEYDFEQSTLLQKPESKPSRNIQESTYILNSIENLMHQSKNVLNSVGQMLAKDKEVIHKAVLTTGRVDSTLRLSDNLITTIDRAATRRKICLIFMIILLGLMIILVLYRKVSRFFSLII